MTLHIRIDGKDLGQVTAEYTGVKTDPEEVRLEVEELLRTGGIQVESTRVLSRGS